MKKLKSKRCTLCSLDRTLCSFKHRPGNEIRKLKKDPGYRATVAARFKVACADAGLSIDQVAQILHVTTRTVRYWFSGKTVVPFAAYKLVRILNRFELPGDAWAGWHMHSGKLWTPEGFAFEPQDGAWWSLIVRQARSFRAVYAELSAMRRRIDTPPSNTGVNETSHIAERGSA